MKKKVLLVAALFVGATTFAQDGLTSKKGEAFLPEAGDWALGFDGQSFVDYVGNMASGKNNNTLNLNNNANTFYGKMFKDETTAYRGMLRIGMGSGSSDQLPTYAGTDSSFVNTNKSSNGFTFIVGAGLEKRRGAGRLQGVYGAQAMFGMIAATNTSTDFGKALSDADDQGANSLATARTLESNNGNTLTFGLEGFAGMEYFILPKFSLGAEVTWGLGFSSTGESEAVQEWWGIAAGSTATTNSLQSSTNVTNGSSSSFRLDNSVGANFKVMFHF